MNKAELANKVAKGLNGVLLKTKEHSPEIFATLGIGFGVAGAVLACKATMKVDTVIDKHKETVNSIHACRDNEKLDEYSEEDAKKDLALAYAQTGIELGKLYAPALLCGTISVIDILTSVNVLKKRNAALTAAYGTIHKSFSEYRERVVERYGADVDKELRYNIKAKTIEAEVVDEETGEIKTVETVVKEADPNVNSDYARFFDESSCHWEKDSEYNLFFLNSQQKWANDKLKARGYLFLNEVYRELDIPETRDGQFVGWRYDPDNPRLHNYVDFGIYKINNEANRNFVNGYERNILLDFNIDGVIVDDCWEDHMTKNKVKNSLPGVKAKLIK